MASNQWIYNTFSVGNNNLYMPTKATIEGYGLQVSGSYASNQLVARDDISEGLVEIPFYVIFNWHNVPYSSRWVRYQGRDVMPIYCNVQSDVNILLDHEPGPNVTNGSHTHVVQNGSTANYDINMNTSKNYAGDFQALPSDSSTGTKEYCMNMSTYNYGSPSFNHFAIPAGSKIRGITMRGVRVTFYDSSNNPIGTSGSVTTKFMYSLSIGVNEWGYWQPASYYWTDEYGSTITSSMVGFTRNYTLDCGSSLDSRFNLTPEVLTGSNRGIAIMFDFHELGGGSGDSNSSW